MVALVNTAVTEPQRSWRACDCDTSKINLAVAAGQVEQFALLDAADPVQVVRQVELRAPADLVSHDPIEPLSSARSPQTTSSVARASWHVLLRPVNWFVSYCTARAVAGRSAAVASSRLRSVKSAPSRERAVGERVGVRR